MDKYDENKCMQFFPFKSKWWTSMMLCWNLCVAMPILPLAFEKCDWDL